MFSFYMQIQTTLNELQNANFALETTLLERVAFFHYCKKKYYIRYLFLFSRNVFISLRTQSQLGPFSMQICCYIQIF